LYPEVRVVIQGKDYSICTCSIYSNVWGVDGFIRSGNNVLVAMCNEYITTN